MGLAALPQVLWRRRIAVAVGALLAIAVTVAGIHRGAGAPPTASSLTLVLIDTPKSLVADAKARGADTIYTRAQLLAGLIADDDAKAVIARRAGLQPSQLAIAGPGAAAPHPSSLHSPNRRPRWRSRSSHTSFRSRSLPAFRSSRSTPMRRIEMKH